MNEFKEFGLSDKFLRNLEKRFITEPTEIQRKTIPLILEGKDIVGGSATGSGKTLAFSASIIEKVKDASEIQALVLAPTRELAEQISESLKDFSKGFPVEVMSIYGGVSIENQFRKIPSANVVVGTPGRILDHIKRKTLDLSKVKYLVLDEVDRMFEMGFQQDVERIIRECPKERQTLMFSATISDELEYLSRRHSKNPEKVIVTSYVDPSKLEQVFYDISSKNKFPYLVQLLKQEKSEVVMVFCNTRKNVDFIANNLELNGINAQAIHGGLNQNQRKKVLGKFHKGEVNVLVCTDVAARGLDIKNVSHVYNYDIPDNLTEYTHRIGRTARAGEEGKVINIVSNRDYETFSDIEGSKENNIKRISLSERPPMVKMETPKDYKYGRKRSDSGERGPKKGGDKRGKKNFENRKRDGKFFNKKRGGGTSGNKKFQGRGKINRNRDRKR